MFGNEIKIYVMISNEIKIQGMIANDIKIYVKITICQRK